MMGVTSILLGNVSFLSLEYVISSDYIKEDLFYSLEPFHYQHFNRHRLPLERTLLWYLDKNFQTTVPEAAINMLI